MIDLICVREKLKIKAENVEFSCTPPEIRDAAQEAIENLLPAKSKPACDKEYRAFDEAA